MIRKLRHRPHWMVLLFAVMVGTWLAVPRDVCMTQLLGGEACVCVGMNGNASGTCVCCSDVASSGEEDQSGAPDSDSSDGSVCVYVSSVHQPHSPERVSVDPPVLALVQLLPFEELRDEAGAAGMQVAESRNSSLDGSGSYRENCVYRI